jgi:hypothetical protein
LGSIQIILEFFSKAQNMDIHGRKHVPHPMAAVYQSLHTCLSRRFSGSHHQDLAVGIAIHHLPIAIILTTFFIIRICTKSYFGFMLTFALMTQLGR